MIEKYIMSITKRFQSVQYSIILIQKQNLWIHFKDKHNGEIATKEMQFSSADEFGQWRIHYKMKIFSNFRIIKLIILIKFIVILLESFGKVKQPFKNAMQYQN